MLELQKILEQIFPLQDDSALKKTQDVRERLFKLHDQTHKYLEEVSGIIEDINIEIKRYKDAKQN